MSKPRIYELSTAVHNGHLFINAVHWLYRCPLCVALMAKADKIAAEEATNGKHLGN